MTALLTMYHSTLASFLCLIVTFSHALDPTRLIYQFPNHTWVENLAVRPSGSLLLTLISTPDLYLIDPLAANPKPQLIHRFNSSSSIFGITETESNTYHLIGSNVDFETGSLTAGSNRIYRVHFPKSSSAPEISVAALVKDAVLLNGLTTLNPTTVLASDSGLGVVWAIDLKTGVSRIVLKDPLMAPAPGIQQIGINGLRLFRHNTLYFDNYSQALLARVRVNVNGTAAGPVEKIASGATGISYDDFALDRDGNAFLTTGPGNSIQEVSTDGSQRIIAGSANSTELQEPTSAQFGRTAADGHVLYVTSTGGVLGGKVVAVDTRGGSR